MTDPDALVIPRPPRLARLLDTAREHLPGSVRVYDLSHARLVADPIEELCRLYDALDLRWPSTMEAAVRSYLCEQPRKHQGRHHYRMEWFGLDPNLLADRFAGYYARFCGELEPTAAH